MKTINEKVTSIINADSEERYNLIYKENLTVKELEYIAKELFNIKLSGKTKQEKKDDLLSAIYQSNYIDSVKRGYQRKR